MNFRYCIVALSLLIFSSGAGAQITWKIKHSDTWKTADSVVDSSICFTSVSCSGNNCTAAAIVISGQYNDIKRITFYRSNDGGLSWDEQIFKTSLPAFITNFGLTKIQQIDSLNVVGIGNLGTVIRTFDGGKTWELQNTPTAGRIVDVHFSNQFDGIIAVADTAKNIITTTDGGKHWNTTPFGGTYLNQCHSYGAGKFRLFKYGHGPLYTTYDNFNTVDSTKPLFDSASDPHYRYLLTNCTFGQGDTILAYSKYWPADTVGLSNSCGMIMRTIDAGKTWENPFIYPTTVISQVDHTTPLDRDTIYAGGISNCYFLTSTNKGATWQADTTIVDTNYLPSVCFGLAMPSDGNPIGIFTFVPLPQQSILTRAEFHKAHVDAIERIIYLTKIYPNPATGLVNIESIDRSGSPVRIIDLFGREMIHGTLSDQGKLTLDFSRLSAGIYDILLNHLGSVFSVGKVVLIGK
jgi:photosystem II stability/assembly factor-like uncharacterized protein